MILQDFYCPAVVNEENHPLCESGAYVVPSDGMKEDYIAFIEERMPINELTEIFGMHDNAEITSAIN
jgi:dynein heavy chain